MFSVFCFVYLAILVLSVSGFETARAALYDGCRVLVADQRHSRPLATQLYRQSNPAPFI